MLNLINPGELWKIKSNCIYAFNLPKIRKVEKSFKIKKDSIITILTVKAEHFSTINFIFYEISFLYDEKIYYVEHDSVGLITRMEKIYF